MFVCGGVAVAHVRDVLDEDHRAVARPDRQVVQPVDRLWSAVGLDRVLELADLRRARRQDQVLRADRVDDVGSGEAARLQRVEVEVHLDLPLLAAVRVGDGRALDRREPRADAVVAEVEELLLGEPLPESASWSTGTLEAL